MVHLRNGAKGLAAVGIHHRTADEVIDEIAPLGQAGIRLGKVIGATHFGAGGIHILHPGQTDQQQIALGADAEKRGFALPGRGSIQSFELSKELRAVAQRQGLHLAPDTVGGDNLAGGKVILHGGPPLCET